MYFWKVSSFEGHAQINGEARITEGKITVTHTGDTIPSAATDVADQPGFFLLLFL